ncbi:hypothetical protein LTR36_006487 [Oleoguttula mirabilis]|uniref:Uncharacterized protein n=1 Tax=Oleoguttula mirabilis TaxID=1507867 RepID=A0AAV9JVG8_9PEZI|nr:hypothetical protein LTR36_006487 [Oleoguttula mirabilis]
MYQSRWAPKPEEEEDKANELRPTTSLSASAPTFSPAPAATAPPPDVSTGDTFAQTGAAHDDLFDDVVPADESMRVRSDDDLFSDDFTPVAQPIVEQAAAPTPSRGRADGARGTGRARGRGRGGGGGGGRGGLPAGTDANVAAPVVPAAQREQAEAQQPPSDIPENAPTGPRKEPVIHSVRGDRRATGGVKKPKLTEDELAEKMARIQIRNAELSAAHDRAEADAASFAHRETEAKQHSAQKQKEERRDRQQMIGEREKNRMRKLKAMEGREWDAEKQEDDFERGGRFDKRGGFAGDKEDYSHDDGREYLYREPRGGRGGGSGTGGRGARATQQHAPAQEDFPALSGGAKKTADAQPTMAMEASSAAAGGQPSWADQVESSAA